MSPDQAPFVILVWLAVAVIAFPSFPPHRAILVIVFSGMLFLPEVSMSRGPVELGPLKFTKVNAIAFAGLFATLLYNPNRLIEIGLVPRWFDVPMIAWCLWPIPSCLANGPAPDGISIYRDALSQTIATTVMWGIPYLLGRIYFTDHTAIRDLAVGSVIAAAVYVPFILWEARMSPQLHAKVYGYMQHDFGQHVRFGGYRPLVFFPHGLVLAMFVTSATVLAVWLRRPLGLPLYSLGLVPVIALMRSIGPIVLGLVATAALYLTAWKPTRFWLLLLVGLPPTYVFVRTTGLWDGGELIEATSTGVEADRAQSLEFRLQNENILIKKALEKPVTGWGGWGRARVYDENGKDISITDGLWIISLGDRGVFGLVFLGAALLIPIVRYARGTDPSAWRTAAGAPATGCAVLLAIWVINNLPNAVTEPFWTVMLGAVASYHLWPDESTDPGAESPPEPAPPRHVVPGGNRA